MQAFAAIGGQGLGFQNLKAQACAFDADRHIVGMAEKAGIDAGRLIWIGALQRDAAPALRSHQGGVQGVAVAQMRIAGVVVHDTGQKGQLDIGVVGVAAGGDEAVGF